MCTCDYGSDWNEELAYRLNGTSGQLRFNPADHLTS